MAGRFDRLTRRLVRDGLRRGILEGNDLWLAVGSVAFLVRVLARKDKPKVVTEQLALGESIVVSHQPAPLRGRAARRAGRAGGHGAEHGS